MEYYNKEYFDGGIKRGGISLVNEYFADFLLKNSKNRKRILEIGCAKGNFIRIIEPYFENIVGIDISKFAVEESKKIVSKAKIFLIDIEKEEKKFLNVIGEEKFDVIVGMHTFEHLKNPSKVIKICKEILNNEGVLLILVPNPKSLVIQIFSLLGLKQKMGVYKDKTHFSFLDRRNWEVLLKKEGLSVDFYGRPFFYIKKTFLKRFYRNYYKKFLGETGPELIFVCKKNDKINI